MNATTTPANQDAPPKPESEATLAAPSGSAAVERKKRQWLAVVDGDVREVTGYSCAPSNPDMWWCPEVGFSGAEGHHLFETRDEAFAKAIAESERDLIALQKRLEGLKRRRQNDQAEPRARTNMSNENTINEQTTTAPPVGSSALLDDTARINWLAEHGRIARFTDGWNVWDASDSLACYAIHKDIREAIDLAMRLSPNDQAQRRGHAAADARKTPTT